MRFLAGANEKLPRAPPDFASFVGMTPRSSLKFPERKYVVCCTPPRTLKEYCCTPPFLSHDPPAGHVGSTQIFPAASCRSGPLHSFRNTPVGSAEEPTCPMRFMPPATSIDHSGVV